MKAILALALMALPMSTLTVKPDPADGPGTCGSAGDPFPPWLCCGGEHGPCPAKPSLDFNLQ
jgi:hypothetical protein